MDASAIARDELGEDATVVGRFEEGLIHDTYEIRTDGSPYVLQVAGADADDEHALDRGLACYRHLRETAIPVPRPVTPTVREFDGRQYALVEKLPGSTGERDISPERVRNAGRYLARLHDATTVERPGRLAVEDGRLTVEPFPDGGPEGWRRRRVAESVERLRAGGLKTVAEEVEALFDGERLTSRPAGSSREVVLCHNDYSPDNILFRGVEVTGILDFDHAYAGNGRRDVVKAANCCWMHDPGADWDVRATFYEGYDAVRELGDGFAATEPSVRVETLAVVVGGMAGMDELSEYERAFYEERLHGAIERARA